MFKPFFISISILKSIARDLGIDDEHSNQRIRENYIHSPINRSNQWIERRDSLTTSPMRMRTNSPYFLMPRQADDGSIEEDRYDPDPYKPYTQDESNFTAGALWVPNGLNTQLQKKDLGQDLIYNSDTNPQTHGANLDNVNYFDTPHHELQPNQLPANTIVKKEESLHNYFGVSSVQSKNKQSTYFVIKKL